MIAPMWTYTIVCNFNPVLHFSDFALNNRQPDNQTENLPMRDPQTSTYADPEQRITPRIPYDEILPPSYFSITHEPPPGYTQVRKIGLVNKGKMVLCFGQNQNYSSKGTSVCSDFGSFPICYTLYNSIVF